MIAIALSNLSLVLLQLDKIKEATDRAKDAIAIAEKLHEPASDQYLYHVRILILLYIKAEDFNRANAIIDDSLFSQKEKRVLLAGCRFAAGKMEDAYNIIKEAVTSIKDEKEAAAIAMALAASNDDNKFEDKIEAKAEDKPERQSNDDTKGQPDDDTKGQSNDDNKGKDKGEGKEQDNVEGDDDKGNKAEDKDKESQTKPYDNNIKKWTDDVLTSIIKYNYAALQGRRFEYSSDRLEQLNDAATTLDTYKNERQKIENIIMENDPFNLGHPDDKPHCLSLDYVLAPSIMLSQVLISKIENFIMSSQYLEGLKIQSGLILDNNDVDNWKSNEVSRLIKEAADSMKHIRNDFNSEAKGDGDVVIKHKALFDVEASIHAIENYRVLCDLAVGIPNGNNVDPDLQQVAVMLTEKINKTLKLNLNSNTAMKEKANEEKESGDKEGKKSRGASRGEKKSLDYNSSTHDLATVRSELLPFINRFGRTDTALWVQWALSETGGVGYGLFGQVSAATSPEGILVTKSNMKDPDAKTYDSLLKEVRARLLEVENETDKRIMSDRDYRHGEKEERILLNAALAKIAAQLGNKDHVIKHIDMMENLTMSLKLVNTKNLQNNDVHYIALAKRFRLDYEEWDTPTFLLPDKLLQRLMDLLLIAKDYVKAAELCCDWNLRKDAYKRIINIFSDISNVPQPPNEEPIKFETIEKLKYFNDEDVNDKETSSPSWTRYDHAFCYWYYNCYY